MAFTEVTASILSELEAIVGPDNIFVDDEKRYDYSHDRTGDYSFLPDVILKPGTPEEISSILKRCSELNIAVTPRGGGRGLAGGDIAH